MQKRFTTSSIDGMDGHMFEHFCAEVLKKNGFSEVSVTPASGDQGVDILASKDGIKYAIQCKNYASTLGNSPVQEVSAGRQFYGCHVGVVLTNSTFTSGAIQLAKATNVLLWDRKKLEELILFAGGLREFGIYTEDECKDDFGDSDDSYDEHIDSELDVEGLEDVYDEERVKLEVNSAPRKGLRRGSKFCIAWSILCFILALIGFLTKDDEIIFVGVGEGWFFLVIGIMLKMLSKTKKETPYIDVCGKRLKKRIFVLLSIIIAYIFCVQAILFPVK